SAGYFSDNDRRKLSVSAACHPKRSLPVISASWPKDRTSICIYFCFKPKFRTIWLIPPVCFIILFDPSTLILFHPFIYHPALPTDDRRDIHLQASYLWCDHLFITIRS